MEEIYENRNFMIFDASELTSIDFSEVLETSEDTVRKSADQTKTFVKWNGSAVPASVESISSKEGPYTYLEMLAILSGPEWQSNEEIL